MIEIKIGSEWVVKYDKPGIGIITGDVYKVTDIEQYPHGLFITACRSDDSCIWVESAFFNLNFKPKNEPSPIKGLKRAAHREAAPTGGLRMDYSECIAEHMRKVAESYKVPDHILPAAATVEKGIVERPTEKELCQSTEPSTAWRRVPQRLLYRPRIDNKYKCTVEIPEDQITTGTIIKINQISSLSNKAMCTEVKTGYDFILTFEQIANHFELLDTRHFVAGHMHTGAKQRVLAAPHKKYNQYIPEDYASRIDYNTDRYDLAEWKQQVFVDNKLIEVTEAPKLIGVDMAAPEKPEIHNNRERFKAYFMAKKRLR